MARLSTVTSAPLRHDDLSDAEYDRRARAVLAAVEAASDRFLQDEVIDIDTSRTGGLLELEFPNGSKVVLNTQPPLHELWLAAPSGGYHFQPSGGRWIDGKGADRTCGIAVELVNLIYGEEEPARGIDFEE